LGAKCVGSLKSSGLNLLALDLSSESANDLVACDLRKAGDIARIFQSNSVSAVIHLAGILPTAFQRDPLTGVDVNVTGSVELLRQAAKAGTKRFAFASSMSVYGSSASTHPLTENDPAAPDEPYGASKRAFEAVGEAFANGNAIEFVALRIARVVGPGIKKTSSPWRSEIFEPLPVQRAISIPFAAEAVLSLVHVEDVARMLVLLAVAPEVRSSIYNPG